jgi:glycosyltransferase involved in cell wall biosynthesis
MPAARPSWRGTGAGAPEALTPVRVGIDVSPLALTRAGTARYLTNLLAELERDPELELRRYSFGGPGRVTRVLRDTVWYLLALPRRARRDRVDLLHCPGLRAPLRAAVPLVVTIHDVAVLREPHSFNRWTRSYSRRTLPKVARAARRIIVGSQFSAGEVVDLLSVPESKVRVIPYGVGPPFTAEGPVAEGRYVLAVSTLEPRKNLRRLVEAFDAAGLGDHELRVVGARGWGGVRVGGDRVRWLGEIDDEELARLYRGAACVAYPSLYEGFGLPVLEAMACGAPVVAPGMPPFTEFADGVAVWVEPLDPASIADGLREAIERRDELSALGPARAARYDWKRAAREHVRVYREAQL